MEAREIAIETPNGPVSGLIIDAPAPKAWYVLAHGAGAGMRHHFLTAIAEGLAAHGVSTLRYQFPYMEKRTFKTDPPKVAVATVRAAVAECVRRADRLPVFAGGKSFGGRMTSTAAAEGPLEGVRGIAFLGFPLHPAKRPATMRALHLRSVSVPMLFLQGTRDDLAEIALMREVVGGLPGLATLHEIVEANHSFEVPKRTGKTAADVQGELTRVAAEWMLQVQSRTSAVSADIT